jgi:hypothetical protein
MCNIASPRSQDYEAGAPRTTSGCLVDDRSVSPAVDVQYALPAGALQNSQFAIVGGQLVAPAALSGAAGTTKGVRVVATNAAGFVTRDFTITLIAAPGNPPAAPASVTVTPGFRGAALSWAPSVDNGSPITKYVVEWAPTTAGTFTPAGSVTDTDANTVVAGLSVGTAYTFRVTAYNANGASSPATAPATK